MSPLSALPDGATGTLGEGVGLGAGGGVFETGGAVEAGASEEGLEDAPEPAVWPLAVPPEPPPPQAPSASSSAKSADVLITFKM